MLVIHPSPEFNRLSRQQNNRHCVVLSRSSLSSRRNLSWNITHFASSSQWLVHVAHPNWVVSSCQQQQVDQGINPYKNYHKTQEYFHLKYLKISKCACSIGYRWQFVQRGKPTAHVYSEPHRASSVAAYYMNAYCTRFVSTNESRAWFVIANPIEVPWIKREKKCDSLPQADTVRAGRKMSDLRGWLEKKRCTELTSTHSAPL